MAIEFVTCRHKVTGGIADIPETALQHLPAYVPVDAGERKRLGYADPPDGDAPQTGTPSTPDGDPPGEQPSAAGETRRPKTRKPAAGAAQDKE